MHALDTTKSERDLSDGNYYYETGSFSETVRPTVAPTQSSNDNNTNSGARGFGYFVLVGTILIGSLVAWRCWARYKRKREQRLMEYRSAQADRVLGDMQMVPNRDLDDEII